MKFDHTGVVVRDLATGRRLLKAALGVSRWSATVTDPLQDVDAQFGLCPAGQCYELIAPRSPASPISRVVKDKVNVINHVAYLVEDLAHEAARLMEAGFAPVDEPKPGIAFGDRKLQFFISRERFLIELIEAPDHRHLFVADPTG